MRRLPATLLALTLVAAPAGASAANVTLRGSHHSMVRQNSIAKHNDFTFLRTPAQVRHFVEEGWLVPLEGNETYRVSGASFPYARPEVRTLVERLSSQYRDGCGERLVVTSATRPLSEQPRNASDLSVHPAGMAVDLRVSSSAKCRSWLEGTLLSLERKGLLDVTREHHPPHYHVAIFPQKYGPYAARLVADSTEEAAAAAREAAKAAAKEEAAHTFVVAPAMARAAVAPTPASASGEPAWVAALALVLGGGLALGFARRLRTGSASRAPAAGQVGAADPRVAEPPMA